MTAVDITALEDLPPFLRTPEVAKLLRTTSNSLVQDRYLRRGVPYIRSGRRILYAKAEVLAYLQQHTVQPGEDDRATTPRHLDADSDWRDSRPDSEPPLRT